MLSFKRYLFKVSTLALLSLTGLFSLLVVLGAVHWAVAGRNPSFTDLLYMGIYVLLGFQISGHSFINLHKYFLMEPEEMAQIAIERYRAVSDASKLIIALGIPFILLALTGMYTWVDSYVSLPKLNYPPVLISVLFLPLQIGELISYPIAIHFEHNLNLPLVGSILNQVPAIFQFAVIYYLAGLISNLRRRYYK